MVCLKVHLSKMGVSIVPYIMPSVGYIEDITIVE